MIKADYEWWKVFREEPSNYLTNSEYRMICEIHARTFNHEVNYPCKCNPEVVKLYIKELNNAFDIVAS